jgi:hypothetical protein
MAILFRLSCVWGEQVSYTVSWHAHKSVLTTEAADGNMTVKEQDIERQVCGGNCM